MPCKSFFRVACFIAVAFASAARAQDLAVIEITAPVGGCVPAGDENVTVRLFNYSQNLPAGTAFNVSYTVNAGAPVTEMVILGSSLLRNGTFTYTFTTQANMTVSGTYTFDASVELAGDINPTNNARTGYVVTQSAASDGGTATGPTDPVLAGSVALTGYTGEPIEWQQSEDGGLRWRKLANTDATLAFDALRHDTLFRARVRNGMCAPALSSVAAVSSSDPIFYSGFEP
jgi:hypothetical protein